MPYDDDAVPNNDHTVPHDDDAMPYDDDAMCHYHALRNNDDTLPHNHDALPNDDDAMPHYNYTMPNDNDTLSNYHDAMPYHNDAVSHDDNPMSNNHDAMSYDDDAMLYLDHPMPHNHNTMCHDDGWSVRHDCQLHCQVCRRRTVWPGEQNVLTSSNVQRSTSKNTVIKSVMTLGSNARPGNLETTMCPLSQNWLLSCVSVVSTRSLLRSKKFCNSSVLDRSTTVFSSS